MHTDLLLQLLWIAVEYFIYHVSLAFLAWSGERQGGSDAFYLVTSFMAGVLSSVATHQHVGASVLTSTLVGGTVAFLAQLGSARFLDLRDRNGLLKMLILVTVSATLFDWLTGSTPVSIGPATLSFRFVIFAAGLVALGTAWFVIRKLPGRALILGASNNWVLEYWLPDVHIGRGLLYPIHLLGWISVLGVAMTVTGVLSYSVLKDVTIAILIAAVASTRGLVVLVGAAVTLAVLKPLAAYSIGGNAGPPTVEALLMAVCFAWIRSRGARTPWRDLSDR